jgi:hypothetical protein
MSVSFQLSNNTAKSIVNTIGQKNYKYLSLNEIVIPPFNNIQSLLGTNEIIYDIGAGNVSITLSDAYIYDKTGMSGFLNNALTVAGFTVSIANYTNLITISHASNFSITDSYLLNYMLGFDAGAIDGTDKTYTSTNPINYFPYCGFSVYNKYLKNTTTHQEGTKYSFFIPAANSSFYDVQNRIINRQSLIFKPSRIYFESFDNEIIVNVKLLAFDDTFKNVSFGNAKIYMSLMVDDV